MNHSFLIGLGLAASGCACLYLSASRQNWLARPWPAGVSRLVGTVLLVAGFVALLQSQQSVAAAFTLLTVAMTVFMLVPYVGAWLSARRRR
ncbi:hypothetical protein [uncultured Propionivibrio sp.]|uniref:hypothetical protein n=1 Tax=uncultured Propionivibrio sp. TaxID=426737 RepID=UPI0029C08DAF|nr:hypothetical protein [uncultured Propionivibrio sp.]